MTYDGVGICSPCRLVCLEKTSPGVPVFFHDGKKQGFFGQGPDNIFNRKNPPEKYPIFFPLWKKSGIFIFNRKKPPEKYPIFFPLWKKSGIFLCWGRKNCDRKKTLPKIPCFFPLWKKSWIFLFRLISALTKQKVHFVFTTKH